MSITGRGAWRQLTWILLAGVGIARAQDDSSFTVTDIRVEGLQRITEGTLFNTLPVNVGDRLDAQRVREALRAVYAMGFFRDVQMRHEEPGVLVVVVQESPSIRSFSVKGNKDIKTEDLNKSLRNVGLAQGKIFNRATLEDVRQALTDQYYAHGRYNVRVDVDVDDLGGNLVDVKIDITEGKRSKIRAINVVGNQTFDDAELLGELELKRSNWLSFYRADDQYSRQSLEGDLEKIRSHYMDRGYADFEITSTQVALAPAKNDLFVTINVFEGGTWKTGAVKLAGRFVVPEEILRQYVLVRPGQVYSQHLIAASEEALRNRLGEAGFAFADVAAVPTADPVTHEIALTFQIEPNMRTYVRRIEFTGVERTRDEVLRREVRQLEGGALSNAALQRSEERLQRLPYIDKAEYETRRVPGSEDLVDVDLRREGGPVVAALGWRRVFRAPGFHAPGQLRRQQPVRRRRPAVTRAEWRAVRAGLQHLAHRSLFHGRRRVALAQRLVHRARTPDLVLLAILHQHLQHQPRFRLPDLREPVPELRADLQPRRPDYRVQQLDAAARLGPQQRRRLFPARRARPGARHHPRYAGALGRVELR